jgi:uncharacterized protein YbbC (DUF1343 family)
MFKVLPTLAFFCLSVISGCAQPAQTGSSDSSRSKIVPAAERLEAYVPLLKNKAVAIFANHTSVAGNTHVVDTLRKSGVRIVKIFAPEHGFRGTADAGEKVDTYTDSTTGIPVVSLYGKKRKPSAADLQGVDVLVFDIQDVGARFYTYISSLEELMEAAIDNNKPLIILDRPNPNGSYIDGPILNKKYRSFIGMQPVPVVYGMTIGEYGKMLLGEKWIDSSLHAKAKNFKLTVIPCENYSRDSKYRLPVRPSPNLPEMQSIYWYPSTCFFEGTALNEGRGTDKAFQIFGHPLLPDTLYAFTPVSREGARTPKLQDKLCYGWNLHAPEEEVLRQVDNRIQLKWLLQAYQMFPDKDSFFIGKGAFFNRLAGTDELMKQIKRGDSEEQIRKSWQPGLTAFRAIRKKYLIYSDDRMTAGTN